MSEETPKQLNKRQTQEELQKQHIARDKGNSFGTISKDPCKKERALSLKCIETNYNNKHEEVCERYFDNYNNCNKFWNAVRYYRRTEERNFKDLTDQDIEFWKKQLPTWVRTKKIQKPTSDEAQ